MIAHENSSRLFRRPWIWVLLAYFVALWLPSEFNEILAFYGLYWPANLGEKLMFVLASSATTMWVLGAGLAVSVIVGSLLGITFAKLGESRRNLVLLISELGTAPATLIVYFLVASSAEILSSIGVLFFGVGRSQAIFLSCLVLLPGVIAAWGRSIATDARQNSDDAFEADVKRVESDRPVPSFWLMITFLSGNLKTSLPLALLIVVQVQTFFGFYDLGSVISQARGALSMVDLLIAAVVISVLGVALYGLFFWLNAFCLKQLGTATSVSTS